MGKFRACNFKIGIIIATYHGRRYIYADQKNIIWFSNSIDSFWWVSAYVQRTYIIYYNNQLIVSMLQAISVCYRTQNVLSNVLSRMCALLCDAFYGYSVCFVQLLQSTTTTTLVSYIFWHSSDFVFENLIKCPTISSILNKNDLTISV